MLSFKPRPFVQSFFDLQAPQQPHVFVPFFFCFLKYVVFSEYFLYHCRFLFVWKVRRTFFVFPDNSVFLPCDHGLDF